MLKRTLQWVVLLALLALVICAGIVAYIDISTARFIYTSGATPPKVEVALVLGASVEPGGILSPVLAERADKAIELYKAGIVSKILVTGDNATLDYDEVYPVGKYLLAAGIPEQNIFLDYAGFDTYSSMYRARSVFEVTSVLVVSQQYHLPRAVFIARSLGMNAYGVDASHGEGYFAYSVREIPADIKATFDLVIHRVPKYQGGPFPVSGEGTSTWVGSTEMIYFQNTHG